MELHGRVKFDDIYMLKLEKLKLFGDIYNKVSNLVNFMYNIKCQNDSTPPPKKGGINPPSPLGRLIPGGD